MPRTSRDDFTKNTKDNAAKRTGFRCSFCGIPTIGPSFESNESTSNTGVAAHICAAAPGGKRYDSSMSPEQRKSIDNCIWMCQTHAHLIDTDEAKYTVEVLKEMKQKAELTAAETQTDVEFFRKYYESNKDNVVELTALLDQMIADGNFDLLRNTLECYSSTISPIFDEIVCRYHIIYDMYCSNDMIQTHMDQYLSLPIQSGADQLIELFISLNYTSGTNQLIKHCSDNELKRIANLMIKDELKDKVICSSAEDSQFKWPKEKEKLLNKYVVCVAKENDIFNLVDQNGNKINLFFNELYFQLFYSAFSLVQKMLNNNSSFESNPEDTDYHYLVQRKKIIKQLNANVQIFIWDTILQFLFFSSKEFNQLILELPIFIKENPEIQRTIWSFKVKNNPETICANDLLEFSKNINKYSSLIKYLWTTDEKSRNEFIEEHKYLLKKDSHFIQLYTKNPDVNMTYDDLLKYEMYYRDDFLYHCLCYNFSRDTKKEHFNWLVENVSKLSIEELFCYLEILVKESRYDLLLEMNQNKITDDARLFIANHLAMSNESNFISEARKIYEDLLKKGCNQKGLHYNYAALSRKSGKFEDAKKHMQKEYELHKDLSSLHGILHLRYETNSVVDDVYLEAAKSIITPEFQNLVAASYVQLQDSEEAKKYYLRTLLLDENSNCIGMLFHLNVDAGFADITDIRKGTVCTLVSGSNTINIAIHELKMLDGINPNNFANCTHLSFDDPSIASLIYAKVNDTVKFKSDEYIVKEIIPLWKHLSRFAFSRVIDNENTIKISGEKPEDVIKKIKGIMLDNRKQVDDRLEEYNSLELSLPLSAFSKQMGKSCLEACEFLALGNQKKIFNNLSFIPYSEDNVYVLSFDAIVHLAISDILAKVSSMTNVICSIQVKNQIDSDISNLLDDLGSESTCGNLVLIDDKPQILQLSDSDKRNRHKYLTELRVFVNSISSATAHDFNCDNSMFDTFFSNSDTIIESGTLGLTQNTKNSIMVTDDQFLYTVANTVGLPCVGLCDFLTQSTNDFTNLIGCSKALSKLNFNNYLPLFMFDRMTKYLDATSDPQSKYADENKLINWLLSEKEGVDASKHHANVVIQLYRDFLNQYNITLDTNNFLRSIAMQHFAKMHPEVIEKAISNLWKKY